MYSRLNSNINHTLKHRFSRHIDEAVLQTEHLLGITAEDSFLIIAIGLLPTLHLTGDSFTDFQFEIIKILNNFALIDKPVWILTVRVVKVILDVIRVIGLAFLDKRNCIEVGNNHCIYYPTS